MISYLPNLSLHLSLYHLREFWKYSNSIYSIVIEDTVEMF